MTGKELCVRLASWYSDHAGDKDAAETALQKAFGFDETADADSDEVYTSLVDAVSGAKLTFGQLASVTRGSATTAFEYDRRGRLTKSTDALGFWRSRENSSRTV